MKSENSDALTKPSNQVMTRSQLLRELEAEASTELTRRREGWRFGNLYPDTGPYRRELYPKHLEFFAMGALYRERCARCANRVGKTMGMGGFETACHLTGRYPAWWQGKVFDGPIEAWAAGKKNATTRDIIQTTLLGKVIRRGARRILSGRGLLPSECIGPASFYQGVADLVDQVPIRHASGGESLLGMKSYEQGSGSFEGTAKHLIWLDEEPPLDVYSECLIRTATTNGIVMITFTPLEGLSEVVLQFMPDDERPSVE